MNDAVMNELGSTSQRMYFKCPSDDGLADLGLPMDAAYPTPAGSGPSMPLFQPETSPDFSATSAEFSPAQSQPVDLYALQKMATPAVSTPNQPVDLYALQKLVNQPTMAPSGYTYQPHMVGPGAGPQMTTPSTPWQKTLVDVLDTTIKAGAPAATAYINYTAAQQMARNQPIRLPGQPGSTGREVLARANYLPWIVGGLAVAGLLVAMTVFSAKK